MTRRIALSLVLLACFTSIASAKLKQDEMDYLDEKFQSVLTQVLQLKTQVDTLTAQIKQMAQIQSDLQQSLMRQQNSLSDVEHALAGMRVANEENLTSLRTAVVQLQGEQQKGLQALTALTNQINTAQQQQQQQASSAQPPKPSTPVVQGYITVVDKDGSTVTVSLGAGQNLHAGSKLALYKGSDNATANRVGVLEVADVIDTGNSHAKVVTLNEGAHPEFGDIVVRIAD